MTYLIKSTPPLAAFEKNAILFLVFLILFCQTAQSQFGYPCFETEIPGITDPEQPGPNVIEEINTDCEFGALQVITYLPSGHAYPACEQDEFGNIQISFGAISSVESATGYQVCVNMNSIQTFIGSSNLSNVAIANGQVCGDLDMSSLNKDEQTCGSITVKYTEWYGPITSQTAGVRIDVTSLGSGNSCVTNQVGHISTNRIHYYQT